MLSARAAAEKEPVSTTRTKACIAANRSMLIPPRNGVYLPDVPAASIAQRSTSTGRARPSAAREVTEDSNDPASQARRLQGGFRGRQAALQRAPVGHRHHAPGPRRAERFGRANPRAQGRRYRTTLRAEGSGRQAGVGGGAFGPRTAGH